MQNWTIKINSYNYVSRYLFLYIKFEDLFKENVTENVKENVTFFKVSCNTSFSSFQNLESFFLTR